MYALALTSASTPDRHVARVPDRLEILSPRGDEARAATRHCDDPPSRRVEAQILRHDGRWPRRAPMPDMPARFLAQYMAQHEPDTGAHVENWRGARSAYARAGGLTTASGSRLSILV